MVIAHLLLQNNTWRHSAILEWHLVVSIHCSYGFTRFRCAKVQRSPCALDTNASFLPGLNRSTSGALGAMGRAYPQLQPVRIETSTSAVRYTHYGAAREGQKQKLERGFEPRTFRLLSGCSTTELYEQMRLPRRDSNPGLSGESRLS